MSKTFAVETYSGGRLRICSIETLPAFRSFFSCARLTRMSFALFSASIRWSSERTGACTCVCGTMSAASYQPMSDVQPSTFSLIYRADNSVERGAEGVLRCVEPECLDLV